MEDFCIAVGEMLKRPKTAIIVVCVLFLLIMIPLLISVRPARTDSQAGAELAAVYADAGLQYYRCTAVTQVTDSHVKATFSLENPSAYDSDQEIKEQCVMDMFKAQTETDRFLESHPDSGLVGKKIMLLFPQYQKNSHVFVCNYDRNTGQLLDSWQMTEMMPE